MYSLHNHNTKYYNGRNNGCMVSVSSGVASLLSGRGAYSYICLLHN